MRHQLHLSSKRLFCAFLSVSWIQLGTRLFEQCGRRKVVRWADWAQAASMFLGAQLSSFDPDFEPYPGPLHLADMSRDSRFLLGTVILTPSPCSYVAFQDIAGTSSLDMTFKGGSYPCTSTSPSVLSPMRPPPPTRAFKCSFHLKEE